MMTRREWLWAGVLGLVVLMVQGCATTRHESGKGFSLPANASFPGAVTFVSIESNASPSPDEWRAEAEARRTEVDWALAQMWAVASGEDRVGTVLEFTFWAERGALTLLSFRGRAAGGAGQPVQAEAFSDGLRGLLLTLAENRTGAFSCTLHRERSRWRVDLESLPMDAPPEARTLPARRTGSSDRVLSSVQTVSKQVARLLQVPSGGSARMTMDVMLEDDRLTGWEPGPFSATGGGTARPADSRTVDVLTLTLLPFLRGLGPRTVRLELSGTHEGMNTTSYWRVTRAETLRPEPADEALEDVLREYRLLHAQIFHRYREEMVDSVELAGSFTLEQVALCAIGGLVGKGLHVAFEAMAPTVMRVVSRGGTGAMGWLRTQIVRAGRQDQVLLRRLFAKVETEGIEALSTAERNELTRIFRSLEQTLTVRLDTDAKKALRAKAQEYFYKVFHPELVDVLRDARGARYDIHHLIPLEYAHLFPELDINAAANLTALGKPVHEGIGKMWNAFRRDAGNTASPEQVKEMAAITQRHFGHWFNKEYAPSQSDVLLEEATVAALKDVRALFVK